MSEYENVAYRIFHDLWLVEIPEIFCYGIDYISEVGTPTTGDKRLDAAMATVPRRRYMTIAAMVLFHDEGADITFVNPSNASEIYRLLVEHMRNWQMIIQNYMSVKAPPAEDFMKMDAFAQALHPMSTWYNNGETPDDLLASRMKTIRGKHSSMLMGMSSRRRAKRAPDPSEISQSQRLADERARRSWS